MELDCKSGKEVSSCSQNHPRGPRLPRGLPFVGFLRHSPKQALLGQLERLLQRRTTKVQQCEQEIHDSDVESSGSSEKLLRASPYVGFQRHAPPSPTLSFSVPRRPEACERFELEPLEACALPGSLPLEVWTSILSLVLEFQEVHRVLATNQAMREVVMHQRSWENRVVRVTPGCLPRLAPKLSSWLVAWQRCAKLVVPRCSQLCMEVARQAPQIQVEVAWRFDEHLKGRGIEVINGGRTVRRVAPEELVVLGDAALPCSPNRLPYLEVQLDEWDPAPSAEILNDFGFGVTSCDPEEIGELGQVADEIPSSWVVDFTQSTVSLSINNREAAKSRCLCAHHLHKGDRVGLLITPEAFEIYINGSLRDRLMSRRAEERVPANTRLFPVLDLYGRTLQISRTDAEGPSL